MLRKAEQTRLQIDRIVTAEQDVRLGATRRQLGSNSWSKATLTPPRIDAANSCFLEGRRPHRCNQSRMVGRLTDPHHGACLDHWKPRRRGRPPRGERLRAGSDGHGHHAPQFTEYRLNANWVASL